MSRSSQLKSDTVDLGAVSGGVGLSFGKDLIERGKVVAAYFISIVKC